MINNIIVCCTITVVLCILLSVPIAGLVISQLPLECNNTIVTIVDFRTSLEIFCIIDIITCILIIPVSIILTLYFIEIDKTGEEIMLTPRLIIILLAHFLLVLCNLIYYIFFSVIIFQNIECIQVYNSLSIMVIIYFIFKTSSVFYNVKKIFQFHLPFFSKINN